VRYDASEIGTDCSPHELYCEPVPLHTQEGTITGRWGSGLSQPRIGGVGCDDSLHSRGFAPPVGVSATTGMVRVVMRWYSAYCGYCWA
jgi:hypothetical protein